MFKMHNIVHFIGIDLHSITLKDKTKIYFNPINQCISKNINKNFLIEQGTGSKNKSIKNQNKNHYR